MTPTPQLTTPSKPIERVLRGLDARSDSLAHEAAGIIRDLMARLEPDELTVDLNYNIATRRGVRVELSPNQASALYQINLKYPELVTVPELAKAVWGTHEVRSINTLRVMMTELRIKLSPLRASIPNKHGKGYRLELV